MSEARFEVIPIGPIGLHPVEVVSINPTPKPSD
jgi:hypothetical protein